MRDRIKELLAQVNFEAFYRSKVTVKSKSGDELLCLCPFHPDKIASLSANTTKGLFNCFAPQCSAKGDVLEFIQQLEKVSFDEAVQILANFAGVEIDLNSKAKDEKIRPQVERSPKKDEKKEEPPPPINPELPAKFHKNLLRSPAPLAYVRNKRGLSLKTIEKFQIGWNGDRFTIPIRDAKGNLVNIRLYDPNAKPGLKMISYWFKDKDGEKRTGYGKARLYGLKEMLERKDKLVWICEGEWDRLIAEDRGQVAVTGTCGAGTWSTGWDHYFDNRKVAIAYDADSAGRTGAEWAATNILRGAKNAEVRIIKLPLKGSKEEKDLTDFFLKKEGTPEAFLQLYEKSPKSKKEDWDKGPGKKSEKKGKRESKGRPTGVEEEEEEIEQESGQKPKRKPFIPRIYANRIMKEFSLKYDIADYFYYYDEEDKIWKFKAHKFLAHWLEMWEGLPIRRKTRYQINEIIFSAQRMSQIMRIPQQPPINLIPFQNCIVDFETGKKYEFGPEYFFINKLAIPYVPKETKIPMIDKFLNSIVADEDVISIIELFGYSMVRKYPYQMSFWLYGGGGNGKSQACELGKRILGEENVSAVRLEVIDRGSFQTANLYGKLMNVSPEIDLQILRRTGIFKQLTGSDLIQFEKKYKDAFVGKNYAKMVFLCNFLPYSFDVSVAFFRRIFLIEFIRMFREESDAISDIATKFPQEEVNAFGYGCFLALRELAKRDFRFSRHKAMEDRREDYLKKSDPLQTFLDEETKRDYDGKVRSVDFNLKFGEYQKKAKVTTLWTSIKIRRIMKDKGYTPQTIRDEDERYEGYRGFSWIDDYD